MKQIRLIRCAAVALLSLTVGVNIVWAADPPVPPLPPEAAIEIDFGQHIRPILESHCAECHAEDEHKGGFSINTRQSVLEGGESGAVLSIGESGQSLLIELVAEEDADFRMPAEGDSLTAEQVGLLRAWIDQGLTWPEGLSFDSRQERSLVPRRPPLPPVEPDSGLTNPIDRLLGPYFHEHGITPGQAVPDRVYARRVYLDILGLLPTPEELAAFINDDRPDKRERLVHQLLDRNSAYAIHWLTFWNDALRNAYRGTGYIDGGREQVTRWLHESLESNKPYDQFVHELIDPVEGSGGFIKGIKWRGVVNASQRREMQAAQTVSQVFMGTNLKCASCHDSFINDWKLSDAYALAGVFAEEPLEMYRCDKPMGETVEPGFLYPQLGTIDPDAPKAQRMDRLADLVTGLENGRLTRTIVNRLWAIFMGRGIVEPVDDMDAARWHDDLLDWLAADLQDHGYDLKRTIALITTSRAYQLPSVKAAEPEEKDAFVFRGPLVRRMTAEQFTDAVSALTGVWQEVTPEMLKPDGRSQGGQLIAVLGAPPEDGYHVRAALTDDNPLMRAMGRPNREQVVTHRDSVATTLQALEMTNGQTLNGVLQEGAKNWMGREISSADELVQRVYLTALGREPTAEELDIGRNVAGSPMTRSGVADLLWVVTMLPEFQLIY